MSEHGKVHWNELMTTDSTAAQAFYRALIGWDIHSMSMDDPTQEASSDETSYVIWMAGETPAGGMFQMSGDAFKGVPAHWMTYIRVDDVDAAVAKTKDLGGAVHKDPCDVPGVGRIAIIADPQGAALGLITPADAS